MMKLNRLGLPRITFYKRLLTARNDSSKNYFFYFYKWIFIKSDAGFTLLELLIVIFLIGVLTAMVMYAFNNGSHVNDLRRASTELVQGIRQAQQNTIGGNSIWYCTSNPNNNMFGHECQQNVDGPCKVNGDNGACKNGVPQGGYALVLNSTNDYTIFGDTDNNGIYGDPPDYTVVKNYISLKGVHIDSFKPYWQTDYLVPGQDNYIVVRFSPPEGTVHFYQKMAGQQEGVEIQDRELVIIVGSDFLPKTCRKITINHVSGQVSETNLPNCTP